jgi:hypothetical protein
VLAQQRQAEGVDRAARDLLGAVAQRVLEADGDLFGGAIRECDGADAAGIEAQMRDQVLDPRDEAERLPGARAGDDKDGAEVGFDGATLRGKRD